MPWPPPDAVATAVVTVQNDPLLPWTTWRCLLHCWAAVTCVCSNGTSDVVCGPLRCCGAPFLLGLASDVSGVVGQALGVVVFVVVGGSGGGGGGVAAFAAGPEHAIRCLGCIDECLACWIGAAIE